MDKRFCFDCVYFVPEGMRQNDLSPDDWKEGIAGDCRRHCPIAGEPTDDDHHVNYAYWPIVLASDWCGEFQQKPVDASGRTIQMLQLSDKAHRARG